ncbi:toxin-antitoxin system YwqK family antitoxin [Flavobacterium sp. C4GT6]|uniref:toxin-antitoxin system YwqK family antitoxin n=1 Tax=Flavobacterium sp. C4GT6 TaxID=3103818 RepID=UPI002ED5BAED
MHKYLLLIAAFCCFSFGVSLKKKISDPDFRYEFYTTDKVVKPESDRHYYWFKGGRIHSSEYGTGGELLHDEFFKYYHSNQLAEAGKFKNGIKEGYWKSWFENGTLQSKAYWNDGQLDGSYYAYDETGNLVEEGRYKNNKKHGRWINYIKGDTLKYKRGELVVKKVKAKDTLTNGNKKPGFFKRLFSKKDKPEDKEVNKTQQQVKPKSAVQQAGEQDKQSFFGRLFSKKDKGDKTKQPKQQKVKKEKVKKQSQPKDDKPGFFKRLFGKKDKKQVSNG